jgi:hypothetical protein
MTNENQLQKWKEIAEFEHALRMYPNNLTLGQGALDAYAENWISYEDAMKKKIT